MTRRIRAPAVSRCSRSERCRRDRSTACLLSNVASSMSKCSRPGRTAGSTSDAGDASSAPRKEGLGYARCVRGTPRRARIPCEVWTNAFDLGRDDGRSLEDALARHSFAVLIATADDLTTSRGKAKLSPRDNVILNSACSSAGWGEIGAFLLVEQTAIVDQVADRSAWGDAGVLPAAEDRPSEGTPGLAEPAAKVTARIDSSARLKTPSEYPPSPTSVDVGLGVD